MSVIKADQALKEYAMTYQVELIGKKDPLVQLEASKLSINVLFDNFSDETKGLKYQVTVKMLLKKYRRNEIEFSPVYFNSTTKTVVNDEFGIEDALQEILIENWINKRSSWIIESIQSHYINISTYRPLLDIFYVRLPAEFKNS